jgi:hypothetical protein
MSKNEDTKDQRDGVAADAAVVTEIEICKCTNESLERGETCGQANCPNLMPGGTDDDH